MNREKEIYKVTLLGSAVNVVLMLFKLVAGIFGHSAAMMADAIHSLSDFATDLVVLAFVRISHKPKDKGHDYGHGKYETLATTLIGVALFAVAVGIIVEGARKIAFWAQGGSLTQPGLLALWAALISILLKEIIFQYTYRKAKKLNSQAMEANAWHHRSDALSSIGTAIGIGGAIIGGERWAVLDPIASIVVGAFIVKVAVDLLRKGVGELMEQSLPEEVENEIMDIVRAVPDVLEPHELCTRRIGNHYAIEMHILMDGDLPLKEAHDKASEIERRLKKRYGEETHVAIHVEPHTAYTIRHATKDDLPVILNLRDQAREIMRNNGNTNQWPEGYPLQEKFEIDIEQGCSYLMIDPSGAIVATFAMLPGPDPTYDIVYNGQWLNDEPYIVVHRIASTPKSHGVLDALMDYCETQDKDIRIDTHADNIIMINGLKKRGFQYIGIIHLANGDERLAFQKKIK